MLLISNKVIMLAKFKIVFIVSATIIVECAQKDLLYIHLQVESVPQDILQSLIALLVLDQDALYVNRVM